MPFSLIVLLLVYMQVSSYLKFLALFVALIIVNTTAIADPKSLCSVVPTVLKQLEAVRKLPSKSEVPCLVQNQEQVRKYIRSQIDHTLRPGQLKFEELFVKAIGFFPAQQDYQKTLIDLYLSQIGGYYDPVKNAFVMASWMPIEYQSPIAIHELTHALQDQYYDLEKVIDHKNHSSDLQLARAALVEGDASAVMIDVSVQAAGGKSLSQMTMEEAQVISKTMVDAMPSAKGSTNGGLDQVLVFPYAQGIQFVQNLLTRGGYAEVDRALQRLPRSTEEVLHFEKYFDRDPSFQEISQEQLLAESGNKNRKVLFSDTYGEFFIRTWLEVLGISSTQASNAASGWGGDRLIITEHNKSKKRRVIWKILWDTERDADQFFGVVSPALQKLSQSETSSNLKLKRKDLAVFLITDIK